jgi:glycerol-3-phosphate dehydrogenase
LVLVLVVMFSTCILIYASLLTQSADHLADAGSPVLLWSRSEEIVKSMNEHHRNPRYLKDHNFSHGITAIGPEFPSKDVVSNTDVILFAIPTQSLR